MKILIVPQKQNIFSKALRHAIKLDELYILQRDEELMNRTGHFILLRMFSGNVPNFVLLKRTVRLL